ncbi:TrmH family RNA methyltransferase [Bacillus sp. 2205SS5-2]|uniref:TrmH family RNA methyltransferase n=1 Tax=Bacillus sp. 2205SS5-2 TaxID=3109031 RepID=UPI003005EA34
MNVVESIKNPKVKQWRKLLTRKERDKTGMFIVEGFHLVEEALKERDTVMEVMISEEVEIPTSWNINNKQMTRLTHEVTKALSDTESPQGVFAICYQTNSGEHLRGTSFLLIDSVQDPGNLGTMIRTADAAGMDAVILGTGTVDAYNPKVLRSAQGSHFHIPIYRQDLGRTIDVLKEKEVSIYGTALENGVNFSTVEMNSSFAILMGNEGSGVSRELLAKTDENLYIPIYGKSESLNVAVAAGILMYSGKARQ